MMIRRPPRSTLFPYTPLFPISITATASRYTRPGRAASRCSANAGTASVITLVASLTAVLSELLVVQELRVDRDESTLASLLELHHAVDRGQDAVSEHLLARLSERVAVDADQLHQPVLERIGGEREVRAQRHGRGDGGQLDADTEDLGQFLGFVSVQPMLAVERRGQIGRVLRSNLFGEIIVADAARAARGSDRFERGGAVHGSSPRVSGLFARLRRQATHARRDLHLGRARPLGGLDEEVKDVIPQTQVLR